MGQNVQIHLPIQDAYLPLKATGARSFEFKELGHFDKTALRESSYVEEDVANGQKPTLFLAPDPRCLMQSSISVLVS